MKPKKKSKLQKKIDNPNSRLWRNKADKLWKIIVANHWEHKCAICGSVEYVQAHHLIPREIYSHRHVIQNGILLCCAHHKYSFDISPHKAPVAFFKWLIGNKADLYNWLLSQTPSRENTTTFKDIVAKLSMELPNEPTKFT